MDRPPTEADQRAATPRAVIDRLRQGNDRWIAGERVHRDDAQDRATVREGQHPLAAVVGCIDSRVPPESVFDVGLGELFVCRAAGGVVDDGVLGDLEFACVISGTPVVVVLGHTACGAVTGACDGVDTGHLPARLARITPAVREVSGVDAPGADPELVDRVVAVNVAHQLRAVTERSDALAGLATAGRIALVGAVYDLTTGGVRWLGQA